MSNKKLLWLNITDHLNVTKLKSFYSRSKNKIYDEYGHFIYQIPLEYYKIMCVDILALYFAFLNIPQGVFKLVMKPSQFNIDASI